MSFGLIYDDPNSPDYQARKEITEFLIRNLVCRITKMLGPVWAQQAGGVPSGCQNTSHMDSWIMALWFFWFAMYQIAQAPEPIKAKIAANLLCYMIIIIVYGDDFLFTKTIDPEIAVWLSGSDFQKFMKKYFAVEIRDLKDGVSFISVHKDGVLVHIGACFLRHYFVVNPYRDLPGQPLFLPFRETKEYIVRAIIGRDSAKPRNLLDVVLSCIGHAYGTYASNRDAYDKLHILYSAAVAQSGMTDQEVLVQLASHLKKDDIKQFNRCGIDVEDILNGFPSWQTLINKNRIDLQRHLIGQDDVSWYTSEELCDFATFEF